jgi:pyruvate,water dikinase
LSAVVPFPGSAHATPDEVGGKGYALIRLAEAGFPVPPGAVLTTEFFAPWCEEIKESEAWTGLIEAEASQWSAYCAELKRLSHRLALTPDQQRALEDLRERLTAFGDETLFAVRSSSPDEDLASASFAGLYRTRLAVHRAGLEAAVRDCFASSLDERVLAYKRSHGFDLRSPRFAVVVQRQLDSEVAGVGFSLNPLNNDFDEVVINANWGQGESVVSGSVSPDQFVVDRVAGRVIDKTLGSKQSSIWLDPAGGTREQSGHRCSELTLDEARVAELTETIGRIETLFEKPVDVEWAYAEGRLHVLQARPITRYVPLAPEMITAPGERRRLYTDAGLSKGMTTNAPFSPMLLDLYRDLLSSLLDERFGIDVTPENGLVFTAGNRLYMNMSNVMRLASPGRMARTTRPNDVLLAEIFANIDEQRYRAATRPPWLRFRLLFMLVRIMWLVRGTIWSMLCAVVAPERTRDAFERSIIAYEQDLRGAPDYGLSLADFGRKTMADFWRQPTFGVLMAALTAQSLVGYVAGRKSAETRALATKLTLGFDGDVVVEMGVALYRLAKLLDRADFEDLTALAERIERRGLPPEFMSAWDAFLARYGWRGPLEMDLASPRYADDPRLALRQMSFMAVDDNDYDPGAAHRRTVEARRHAYAELMDCSGWLRRLLLRRIYRIIDLFAGSRDTPKHQIVLAGYALRKRVLIEGERLVEEGRLDVADDVFNLTFADLERARSNPALDLRQLSEERTRFFRVLEAQVTEFPQVIDSRGRILRPAPREQKPGELRGMPVSSGIATGPVKVLRNPHEKSVNKGDVLVAYTTDPGWTPLFVNASAVVLEIGGVLQHGAVVAREYGKPCVAGIDRLMSKLKDGQIVEVDGTTGVVRLVVGP